MNDNKTYYLYGKINKAVYALLFCFLYLLHICFICLKLLSAKGHIVRTYIFNKNFIKFVDQYVLCK